MAFSFRAGTNWCHDFPKLARESGFYFNMHSTRVRVDWNRISSIDIDRVVRERDFITVDENVNNVVDYCLESEYDVKILDPNFVKLFRLAQLAVEYLLYCKQYLDHSVVILKDELRLKLESNAKFKKEASVLEDTIKDLKEKLKERDKIIETKINERHSELYKCPHCMKTFLSAIFVSAHIARRHPNLSDPYLSYSPVHEQYRVETEKLHNEIKTLKERLNQTERVVRNESYMISDDDKMGREERIGSYERGEHRGIKEQNERMEDQHRRYQEEIHSLKDMLFNEIRNFKQRDANVSPLRQYESPAFSTNVKELILQQEKEILNLKDQLHVRLTPDLESMQEKLHVQENYWKSKIEHLENQHRLDTENLATQLKLTQEAASRVRIEYETKVNDLERQSISQSKMLTAQGEQLNHLTRDIQDSQKMDQGFKNFENGLHEKLSRLDDALKKRENIRDIKYSNRQNNRKHLRNHKNDTLIFEDVENMSSQESPKKLVLTSLSRQYLQEDTNHDQSLSDVSESTDETESNKQIALEKHSRGSREVDKISENSLKSGSLVENLNLESIKSARREKIVESSPERYSHKENFIETLRSNSEKHTRGNNKSVFDKHSTNATSVQVLNLNNKFKKAELHAEIKKMKKTREKDFYKNPKVEDFIQKSAVNPKNHRISTSESEESELSTETESDSEISESESESESIKDNGLTQKDIKSASPSQNYEKIVQENPTMLQELRNDVQEIFNQKIRDLGIDPEWNGIPKETLEQKMETVKHHQNINSKKLTRYNHIRQKIIQELPHRLSAKRKESKVQETEKKSSLNKLMTHVKTKALNALNSQKYYDTQGSRLKSQATMPRGTTVPRHKPHIDLLPKKIDQLKMHEIDRKSSQIDTTKSQELKHQFKSKPPLVSSSKTSSQYRSEVNNDKDVETLIESSNGSKQISHSYESIKDLLRDAKNSSKMSERALEITGIKVTSTPSKGATNVMQESYMSMSEKFDSLVSKREKARSLPVSPKSNKSVLKSTTGSVGSLVKKKVLFDLEKQESPEKETVQQKSLGKLFAEYESDKNVINADDWNISSISDEEDRVLQKEKSTSADSIALKTFQSDKIAQISKKIQEQLSITRQKPVGAIEAMFLTKPLPKMEDQKYGNHYQSSTSITSSVLESPYKQFQVKSILEDGKVPQPAPRTPRNKDSSLLASENQISRSRDSNLESDIEELLQME